MKTYIYAESNSNIELVGAVFIKPKVGDTFFRLPKKATSLDALEEWTITEVLNEKDQNLLRLIAPFVDSEVLESFLCELKGAYSNFLKGE